MFSSHLRLLEENKFPPYFSLTFLVKTLCLRQFCLQSANYTEDKFQMLGG